MSLTSAFTKINSVVRSHSTHFLPTNTLSPPVQNCFVIRGYVHLNNAKFFTNNDKQPTSGNGNDRKDSNKSDPKHSHGSDDKKSSPKSDDKKSKSGTDKHGDNRKGHQ